MGSQLLQRSKQLSFKCSYVFIVIVAIEASEMANISPLCQIKGYHNNTTHVEYEIYNGML